jgi:hypothetical protein
MYRLKKKFNSKILSNFQISKINNYIRCSKKWNARGFKSLFMYICYDIALFKVKKMVYILISVENCV